MQMWFLSGPINFTLSSSSDGIAVVAAYYTTTFDTGTPISADGANVSAADGTSGSGPSPPATNRFIIEWVGIEKASGITPDVLTSSTANHGGRTVGGVQLSCHDYYALGDWHVGSVADSGGWA